MAHVNPIPKGFNTVSPHLVVKGAAAASEFYQAAFGAEEAFRMPGPDGTLMHVELRIGNSRILLADEFPQWGTRGPKAIGGTAVTVHLYVEDADAAFQRAVTSGAKVIMPLEDQFWGDRYGKLEDPFGHQWSIASRKENLTPEQIAERAPTVGF